jgi:HAMP domain-containing protein
VGEEILKWMQIIAALLVAWIFVVIGIGLSLFSRLRRVESWQNSHSEPIERLGHEQEATDAAQALARRRPHRSGSIERPH